MEISVNGKGGKRARKRLNQLAALKRWEKARAELSGPSPSSSSSYGDVDVDVKIEIGNNMNMTHDTINKIIDPPSRRISRIQIKKAVVHNQDNQHQREKKSHLKAEENLETSSGSDHSWCLVELGQINELCAKAVCPSCLGESLKLKKGAAHTNIGFSEPLILVCVNSRCSYSSETVYSSPKMKESSQGYEVNSLMTKYADEIGKGNAVLLTLQQFLKPEK